MLESHVHRSILSVNLEFDTNHKGGKRIKFFQDMFLMSQQYTEDGMLNPQPEQRTNMELQVPKLLYLEKEQTLSLAQPAVPNVPQVFLFTNITLF